MRRNTAVLPAFLATVALSAAGASQAACSAHSGAQTAALIELYTSEGCSSCPPAEKTLASLPQLLGDPTRWAALALHVDYWDYIGWQDPYAQAAFSERQHWLVQANHHRTVYTPHFFVNGAELAGGAGELRQALDRVSRTPAAAQVQLQVADAPDGALRVQASASAPTQGDPLALYVALNQGNIESKVARGENGGSTLHHQHVVRSWMGPYPLADGAARVQHDLDPAERGRFEQGELVAFVENQRSGAVLQVVSLGACKP